MIDNISIEKTSHFIQMKFSGEGSGHDWWHMYRVWQNAKMITAEEGGDPTVIQLAALLHDLDDWKLSNSGDESPRQAKAWLESISVDTATTVKVCEIIKHISFKGAAVENRMNSLEGFIVQDADRLDAIGAIGIARAFAYGGYKERPFYEPGVAHQLHKSFEEYKKSESSTIHHFHEKLLLLKDMMNTETGKRIAQQRHEYMLGFLEQFMQEWGAAS